MVLPRPCVNQASICHFSGTGKCMYARFQNASLFNRAIVKVSYLLKTRTQTHRSYSRITSLGKRVRRNRVDSEFVYIGRLITVRESIKGFTTWVQSILVRYGSFMKPSSASHIYCSYLLLVLVNNSGR